MKISGKSSRGRSQAHPKTFRAPIYGASRGLLCDSSAFLFSLIFCALHLFLFSLYFLSLLAPNSGDATDDDDDDDDDEIGVKTDLLLRQSSCDWLP